MQAKCPQKVRLTRRGARCVSIAAPWHGKAAATHIDGADLVAVAHRAIGEESAAVGVRDGMTISLPAQSPQRRRTARIAGVWFVIIFVASIPALLLYDPVLNDTG
jgi:hypothetical protein